MRPFAISSLVINLLFLVSATWAWSMPDIFDGLLKRDTTSTASDSTVSVTSATASDNTASTGSATTATGTTASVTSASNTGTASGATSGTNSGTDSATDSGTASGTASGTNSGTNSGTSSGTTSGTNSKSKTTSTTSISVNPADAAGGASFTNPPATSTTYYKIGNNVTMGWNYTSVQITPSAVDVIASCSLNKATYTLASNASYNTTSITWDTENYGSDSEYPLITAEYTIIVYESGTSPTDVASAGELGPASHTFGMYLPQSYTPLNEWTCVTCSAAMPDMERQTFGFMLTMAGITVATFTIFAGGFGAVL